MKKLYSNKIFLMVVSLFASLVLWVYVTSMESDDFKQTFRNVPIEVIGESNLKSSRNMEITDFDTTSVSIEVTGPRRIVGSLSSTDLIAQVDVSKLSRVSYTAQQYTIVFPDKVDTSKITITKKMPETVSFMVSNVTEKTVQVKGSFVGSIAQGYKAQKATFEPATITVTGPEVYLRNIDYAWVSFGEDNVDQTYSVETTFTLMDSDGEPCSVEGITVSTDTVLATLPILEVKNVPLTMNLIYGAGANAENTTVSIEPQFITLSGDSGILNDYNQIVLGTIDVTGFSAKTEEMVYTIKFDNALNNDTGLTEAKVVITVSGLETKQFTITNIQTGNAPDGYDVQVINEQLTVTLRGPAEELEKIVDDDVSAIIDWSDFNEATGSQELPARIRIDAEGTENVGAIYSYFISVAIQKGT